MSPVEDLKPILGRRAEAEGAWQIYPAKPVIYENKVYFAHGFSDETSSRPNTFVLSEAPDKFVNPIRVQYEKVEFVKRTVGDRRDPTSRTLFGYRIAESPEGIPAMMVSDRSLCWVKMLIDPDHTTYEAFCVIGPMVVTNANTELKRVPRKEVVFFV